MKREAEARRKFEENLDKPITITKRQFMELSAKKYAVSSLYSTLKAMAL